MQDSSRPSRYRYSERELEMNKLLAYSLKEIEKLRISSRETTCRVDAQIKQVEEMAHSVGISDDLLEMLKTQSHFNSTNGITHRRPERLLSREFLLAEANASIAGNILLEDICSEEDFQYAFRHLSEIDAEFKKATGLTKTDLLFIGVAVALQCVRQYVLQQPFMDKNRLTHTQGDNLKKIVPKQWQDILCGSVPYDAIKRLDKDSEKTGLGGNTHRYRTLGHDPVLGWLFGPVNILSDTLTKTDFLTSYNVEDMKIGSKILTIEAFYAATEQAKIKFNLPVAVLRQGIHFGSDYFTKQGLPIPLLSFVNNDVSKFLVDNNINMLNVTEGIALTSLINGLISCIHGLFNINDLEPQLYRVRTSKILSISNTIASTSNILVVALTKSIKLLDIGGLLVTISRVCTDLRFISRVKQEYIEKRLDEDWKIICDNIDRLLYS